MKKVDYKNIDLEKMLLEGCLLTSGNINDFNTMTIGWGSIGFVWHKPYFSCFVKPIRYTYEFMEKNDIYTISFFKDKYKKEMIFLGRNSGRDVNKIKETGLHPVECDGSTTFEEAYYTIVCRKMYHQDLDINYIEPDIIKRYYEKEQPHRVYYGEIIAIYQNENTSCN